MKGSSKAKEYIRFRPNESELDDYSSLCFAFWDSLSSEMDDVREYIKKPPSTENLRNRNGGSLIFRPAALIPFVRAIIHIYKQNGISSKQCGQEIEDMV